MGNRLLHQPDAAGRSSPLPPRGKNRNGGKEVGNAHLARLTAFGYFVIIFDGWRGTQVVRERSAKPLCVGSIPTRASKIPCYFPISRRFVEGHMKIVPFLNDRLNRR